MVKFLALFLQYSGGNRLSKTAKSLGGKSANELIAPPPPEGGYAREKMGRGVRPVSHYPYPTYDLTLRSSGEGLLLLALPIRPFKRG